MLIRNLSLEEVREAVRWADREGWEPGLGDAEPFFAADPEAFFAAEIDGRVVATISAVRCSADVVFMGFYIVEPGLRGTGVGRHLYDEIVARLGGLTLGGDAVPQQVANYETEGFEVAYWNARYSSSGLGGPAQGADPLPDGQSLVPAASVNFDALVEFDARHCFGPRPQFLELWIAGPGRDSVVATTASGEISGFAASRQTGIGHRIGPVFADGERVAESLILTLAGRLDGRVAVDVPQPNADAVSLLEAHGMERSFETARIYRGPAPELPLRRIFGITSLELG